MKKIFNKIKAFFKKKLIKRILCGLLGVLLLTLAIFTPFLVSFIKTDDDFTIKTGAFTQTTIMVNGEQLSEGVDISSALETNFGLRFSDEITINLSEASTVWFNYYGIIYTSDAYLKATLTYKAGLVEKSEDFFLEPSDTNKSFYSFVDDMLDGKRGNKLISLTFTPLNSEYATLNIGGFSTFNREIPEKEIFIEADNLKLGIDLLWGGALSYLEDTNSNVQAVKVDDTIKVDSNAAERYSTESVNDNVNLINRNDTGRLVQQSYYGTLDYDHGVYMENDWRYNPVQGGNQFNDHSKIVDIKITDSSIYIKCRPLDWAKEKEYITPSYMEATYSIENGAVHTTCRFVDFSGYPEAESDQEIPAFYCIAPLDRFVYYAGDEPWTDGDLTYVDDLIFWPDAGYPHYYSKENWAAFTGEFDDSFGIGIYVPDEEEFLTGIYERDKTTNEDPSCDGPTSYIAITKTRTFRSFEPFSYDYYLATGTKEEIRDSFKEIDN